MTPGSRNWRDSDWWAREIHRGEDKRRDIAQRQNWTKIYRLIDEGGMNMSLTKESHEQAEAFEQSVFINWPWAFASVFVPAVYWRQPRVNILALKPANLVGAKVVQPMVNSALKRTRFRTHLRRAIWDALKYGHGWIKLGWYTRFGEVPTGAPATGPAEIEEQVRKDKGQSRIAEEAYLRVDTPYSYRINPRRMVVDPDATCYEEARWIAQESIVDIESVRDDPYLKHTDTVTPLVWGPEQDDEATLLPWDGSDDDQPTTGLWARYWEIWDREHQRVCILCHGSKDFNRVVEPWPWQGLYGFPFKFLTLGDSSQGFYPVSPIVPWLPLVEEQSFLRTMRMEAAAKMFKKLLVREGAFTEAQLEKLADPEADIVKTSDDPRMALIEVKGLEPDTTLYVGEEKAEANIREISGFSELLSGQVPYSRIAATTTSIMQQNVAVRFQDISERIGEFIIECAQDLFKICRDFQDYPTVVLVSGQPEVQYLEVKKDEIEGDYYFSLDLEELSVSSKQQRVKEAVDLFMLGSQARDAKARSLWRDVLLAYGKTDIDDYCNPEAGPPLDPQYENSLLVQGIPVQPNPGEDFELHLMTHNRILEDPRVAQLMEQAPAVMAAFREHLQKTLAMVQAVQAQGGQQPPQGPPQGGASPTPSMQQGQAMPASQPPGGPTNAGRGGGAQAMGRAMTMAKPGGI